MVRRAGSPAATGRKCGQGVSAICRRMQVCGAGQFILEVSSSVLIFQLPALPCSPPTLLYAAAATAGTAVPQPLYITLIHGIGTDGAPPTASRPVAIWALKAMRYMRRVS